MISCSSKDSRKSSCWDESKVSFVKDKLISVMQNLSDEKLEPKLIEESCKKRKYQVGEHFLIIANSPDKSVEARTFRASAHPKQCLERALESIANLNSEIDNKIVSLHKSKFPESWQDVDLSPVGWLNCTSTQADFDDSVTTFLHELTHQIKELEKQCMYLAISKKQLCFDFSADLPLRSYGKQESFPTANKDAVKGLTMIQKIYLTDTDQAYFWLLDELNAYALTAFNYSERLKLYGSKAFFDKEGKRPGVFLPLFYKISVDYLLRLKQEDRELFNKEILENKVNRDRLKELFTLTQITYQDWRKQLRSAGKPERDWEKALFKQAVEIQNSLKL